MAALATVSALETLMRLPVGSLAGEDLAAASAALEFASELVRYEGRTTWGEVEDPAPVLAVQITVEVARRRFENPTGYSSETKGPFSYDRPDELITAYLTDDEKMILQGLAYGRPIRGFVGSVRTPSPWDGPALAVDPDPIMRGWVVDSWVFDPDV